MIVNILLVLHIQAYLKETDQKSNLAQRFYDISEFTRQNRMLNMIVNFIATRTVEVIGGSWVQIGGSATPGNL